MPRTSPSPSRPTWLPTLQPSADCSPRCMCADLRASARHGPPGGLGPGKRRRKNCGPMGARSSFGRRASCYPCRLLRAHELLRNRALGRHKRTPSHPQEPTGWQRGTSHRLHSRPTLHPDQGPKRLPDKWITASLSAADRQQIIRPTIEHPSLAINALISDTAHAAMIATCLSPTRSQAAPWQTDMCGCANQATAPPPGEKKQN